MKPRFVLTLSCINRPGIVAAVSGRIAGGGGDIREAQQYDDAATGRFFMRVVFAPLGIHQSLEDWAAELQPVADAFGLDWRLRNLAVPLRVLLMVSRPDHCLADLLYRHRIGELPMTLAGVVSNHPRENLPRVHFQDIPFHHVPITAATKLEAEATLWRLIEEHQVDLVVLARYMQILSPGLSARLHGRCINIHHSFLPGFKGARPYHRAHERGVKLIGATAHYVTGDLDEGPIIEQDVERVLHSDTPDDLVRRGRDIERRVLARAVEWHLQDRILLNDGKTVVFR